MSLLEFVSLELQMAHTRRTHTRGGAVSQASPWVTPAPEVLNRFCYWHVNDSSKLMEQADTRQGIGARRALTLTTAGN